MLSRRLSRVLGICKGTYLDRHVLSQAAHPPTCRLYPSAPPQGSPHRLLHHSRSQRTHRPHSTPRLARRVQGAANRRRLPTCSAWSNHCRPWRRERLCGTRCCRLDSLVTVQYSRLSSAASLCLLIYYTVSACVSRLSSRAVYTVPYSFRTRGPRASRSPRSRGPSSTSRARSCQLGSRVDGRSAGRVSRREVGWGEDGRRGCV